MASQVAIVNLALVLLGESQIISIDDGIKAAREAKAVFAISRDALLAQYNWCFAFTRVNLPAVVAPPVFGFDLAYQLPADCLRVIVVGDHYVGCDLADYRQVSTEEYVIEGRQILTSMGAPLQLQYVKRVEDTTQFDPCFTKALGCQLAVDLAESLTQTGTKKDRALVDLKREVSAAIRANAIQLPPKRLADDDWIISRR